MLAAFILAMTITTSARAASLEDGLLAGAAARLDTKGVELALKRGAKPAQPLPLPDAPTVTRTPLQFALLALIDSEAPDASQKAEKILRALFKSGAKLTGDKDELFPAIAGGHERIVTLLLDQGANPHARIYGYTPAELAIKHEQPKLLPILYARGVPKVPPEAVAQIQFVHAAGRQQLAAMQAAIAAGAEVNSPDPAGSYAVVQMFSVPLIGPENYEAARWLLLDANADPNAIDASDNKSTALHKVVRRNSSTRTGHVMAASIVEILLRKGADVSPVDDLGRTPLHYAAQSGNTGVMQMLVGNGAKIMARDALGKTPLNMAKSGEAINLLREAGATE